MNIILKNKRIISFVLFLISIFTLASVNVLAAEIFPGERGYVNIKEYCNEGSSTPGGLSDSTYMYQRLNGETTGLRMMFLADTNSSPARTDSSGKPIFVYCMEFGEEINSYLERTATDITDTRVWKELGDERQLGITLATLYGCPANTYGFSKADAYAATQAIIWEFQTGIRSSITENSRSDVTYKGKYLKLNHFTEMLCGSHGSYKSAMRVYDFMINFIFSHRLKPNFSTSTIVMNYYPKLGNYSATVPDSNSILHKYRLSSSNPAVVASKSGNNLVLSSKVPITSCNISFERELPHTTSQSLLALGTTSSAQTTIVGQLSDPVFSNVNVITNTGNLAVQKDSEDGNVAGIEFSVVGNEINTVIKSDGNGNAALNQIPAGEYSVTEHVANKYVPQNSKKVLVYLNGTSKVIFSNRIKRGTLNLSKIDDGTGKGIPGAEYGLFYEKNQLIQKISTDKNGKAKISNLLYGNYVLRELVAPNGYKISDEVYPVNIENDNQQINIIAEDEAEKYKAAVYKTGEVLTDFKAGKTSLGDLYKPVYEEQYLNDCVVDVFAAEDIITADGTLRFSKDELVDTVITSDNGPAFTKELFEGNYYAKENRAPNGFVINTDLLPLKLIDEDQEITLSNDRQKMKLYFRKQFQKSSKNKPSFENVLFGIYSAEDIKDLKKDSLIEIIKPDERGFCESLVDLPVGYKYYVKELYTSNNYLLDENLYTFSTDFVGENTKLHYLTINNNLPIINEERPKAPLMVPRLPTPLAPLLPEKPHLPPIVAIFPQVPLTGDENKVIAFITLATITLIIIPKLRKHR